MNRFFFFLYCVHYCDVEVLVVVFVCLFVCLSVCFNPCCKPILSSWRINVYIICWFQQSPCARHVNRRTYSMESVPFLSARDKCGLQAGSPRSHYCVALPTISLQKIPRVRNQCWCTISQQWDPVSLGKGWRPYDPNKNKYKNKKKNKDKARKRTRRTKRTKTRTRKTEKRGKAQRVPRSASAQMRLCIPYLHNSYVTATKRMTFKNVRTNQRTAHFGHVCIHPLMQMNNKISGVTGPKFTKFLSVLDESSWMSMQ